MQKIQIKDQLAPHCLCPVTTPPPAWVLIRDNKRKKEKGEGREKIKVREEIEDLSWKKRREKKEKGEGRERVSHIRRRREEGKEEEDKGEKQRKKRKENRKREKAPPIS